MNNNSYYKKQKQLIIGIIGVVVLLVALICGISFMKADRREEKAEKPTYTVTVYKSLDGLVTCTNDEMVDTEDTSKLLLKAHGDEEVTLNVLADEGKRYAGTEVMDDTATSISVSENAQSANEEEISFTMPKSNVTVSVYYEAQPEPTPTPEPTATPEPKKYNISVSGMTDEILQSYKKEYSENLFVNAFGNYFGMSNPDSKYYSTYRITFTPETVDNQTEDMVSHYAYLNDDEAWKVLVQYSFLNKDYAFTDLKPEPTATPLPTATPIPTAAPSDTQSGTNTPAGTSGTGGGGVSQPQTQTIETAFDVQGVSTVFLQYVGSESTFYDEISNYVFNSGLTGQIVGNFSFYEIDPESDTVTFTVDLSAGGAIEGSYSKDTEQYSFSGL